MTNFQLIELLKSFPEDATVSIAGYTGAHNVQRADVTCKENKIVIETVVDASLATRRQVMRGEAFKG